MRAAALAALVGVVLVAGCGGSSQQAPLGGAAVFTPANAVAFLAARTDSDWRPLVRRILHKRPPRIPKDTVEVDIAVIPGGTKIVMTKPAHGDWRGSPANQPSPTLIDNANYRAAMRAAPKDTTATVYVRGDVAAARLAETPGQVATLTGVPRNTVRIKPHLQTHGLPIAVLRWRWLSAWATKDGFGARFRSGGGPVAASQFVRSIQQLVPPYVPALLDEIPADAQRVIDVMLPPATFSYLTSVPVPIRALLPGVDPAALDQILGGETALYTRPRGETTIVTSPGDVTTALNGLAAFPQLHTAVIGGQLVISTTPAGIAALRGDGPRLGGKVHIPPRVAGFVWERGKRVAFASREGPDVLFTARPADGGS